MAELSQLTFWRLFHSLLRHGNTPEEVDRATAVFEWVNENMTQIRKCCLTYELDLVGFVYSLGREASTLPSYDLVKEKVAVMDNNEGALEGLKEYETVRDSQLSAHYAPEMNAVLKDHMITFENLALLSILDKAKRITTSSAEHKKRKLSGAREAVNFIMERIEDGNVIVSNTVGVNRPILVQNEAEEVGPWYDRAKEMGFLPSGLPEIEFMRSNFVGILGHAGQGKSTLGRFILYTMAAAGHNCLHISLENDQEVERNKYILLHAHNQERFGDAFLTLSYEDFYKRRLTTQQRSWLPIIAKDFRDSIAGNLIVRQPPEATWEVCKGIMETQERMEDLEGVLLDYVQLIDPPARNTDDRKTKMNAIVKDMRQYALTAGSTNKRMVLISPVQGNEDGFKRAKENEGVWELSGVNNEKELSRSMDVLLGIFDQNNTRTKNGIEHQMVISSPKARDVGFKPFPVSMSGCGWFTILGAATSSKINIGDGPAPDTLEDIPVL
jgi:hypothetical protein